MATRAIKPKRENTMLTDWQSMPEVAPSEMRADQPTVARVLAMLGVMLVAVGLLAMLAPGMGWHYPVGAGWGTFFLSIGLVLVLYHAFIDKDLQFRRIYMGAGLLLAGLGVLFHVLPLAGRVGGLFMPYGIYALSLALLLLVAVLRNEDSVALRSGLLRLIGVWGAVMILAGLVVGHFNVDFLTGEGVLLLILGLFYAGAFIGMQDVTSQAGYYAGVALGVVGTLSFLITLVRVFVPALSIGDATESFLVPSGLILLGVSIAYVAVALAVCSDWPLVVLVRRELAAYFYSPMAYLVLVAMMLVSWLNFMFFVDMLGEGASDPRGLVFEPIVRNYFVSLIPVIAQIFVVPVLTMRLLSEEKRTGTLEMVLTVPVNETTITVSKFLAAWLFYLLTWVPTFLFLVAMRALGGDEFDYRPLLSFSFAVMATGAGFIAMGLFFSSLTKNQIIAAVFTFVGMTAHLAAFFLARASQDTESSIWGNLFNYMSFVNLWIRSLEGILAPRYLVFHVSAAIFFLYLTNKVLEARKWS